MKVLTEKQGKVDAFWVRNFLELSYVGNTYYILSTIINRPEALYSSG